MAKHGKSYNAAAEKIDRATLYTPLQAAKLIKELDTAKFDETVEAHFRLGVDTRKADQNIRGSISLPHAPARPFVLPSSPRARRPARPRLPARYHRFRRARRPDPEGRDQLRRRYRYAEHDGQGWPHR
mgnify:CR=1 FL=1